MSLNAMLLGAGAPSPATPRTEIPSTFNWAVVTARTPALVIRFDGETTDLGITPDSLVSRSDLLVGDRVWTQRWGRRVIVLGRAQTALDEWTTATLENGWANYDAVGSGYSATKYRREGGYGVLTGLVKHATTTTTGTILTLPTALWPDEARVILMQSNTGEARINVKENDGTVQLYGYYNGGSANFVSLDEIRWPLKTT